MLRAVKLPLRWYMLVLLLCVSPKGEINKYINKAWTWITDIFVLVEQQNRTGLETWAKLAVWSDDYPSSIEQHWNLFSSSLAGGNFPKVSSSWFKFPTFYLDTCGRHPPWRQQQFSFPFCYIWEWVWWWSVWRREGTPCEYGTYHCLCRSGWSERGCLRVKVHQSVS